MVNPGEPYLVAHVVLKVDVVGHGVFQRLPRVLHPEVHTVHGAHLADQAWRIRLRTELSLKKGELRGVVERALAIQSAVHRANSAPDAAVDLAHGNAADHAQVLCRSISEVPEKHGKPHFRADGSA
jgi:hypothetical protein